MAGVLDVIGDELRSAYGGRAVILAGGVAVTSVGPIEALRRLGAGPFLVIATGAGTGPLPSGPDVEVVVREVARSDHLVDNFREEERDLAEPSADALDAADRFDPLREALVLVPPFLDVQRFGDRTAFGARRPEWVALEDKTRVDDLFDAAGVEHPSSTVVASEVDAISRAAADHDLGAGTVWSGDARDGFNGAATYVRWVRDDVTRAEALAFLLPRCDRIRVASFVEGVPCSIHGFVVDDGVAVFRPVELLTLRAPSPPTLRFFGCATFFDPAPATLEIMRSAARRVGEHLRRKVGYRGAFTVDGIVTADGWLATECNPRFGAGLGYVDAALPDTCFRLLHHAVVEGVASVGGAPLERAVVDAAARRRWGSVGHPVPKVFADTHTVAVTGGRDGCEAAGAAPADAVVSVGPGRSGGNVRIDLEPGRVGAGPSIAPLVIAALSFADRAFDLGLGPLTSARPAG